MGDVHQWSLDCVESGIKSISKHFCFIIFYPFKVARLVKVTQTDSPYFKIISPHDVGHKVAPGMDTIFIIQFTPDEKKVFVVKTSHKQLHVHVYVHECSSF